jgi:hypothetical protein
MSVLSLLSSWTTTTKAAKKRRRAHRNKLALRARIDRLEERALLTVTPVGPETLVNTTVAGDQGDLSSWSGEGQVNSVAADSNGNYVVVWEGNGVGDSYGVFAQQFQADGTPRGSELRVNSTTADSQVGPVVATDHAGDFAVAWSTRASAVGGNLVAYARVFNADGTARTGDIQVTPASTSQANFAMSIAMDASGDFVVLTDGWVKSGKSTDSGIIQFQRYDALGQAQGKLVQVDDTKLVNGSAAVAMDNVGDFAVAWNDDGDAIGARVQRYSAAGKKVGSLIATGLTSGYSRPGMAMDGTGRFAVTGCLDVLGPDGRPVAHQLVRSFDANGTPQGPAFDYASGGGAGYRSAVAIDTQGNAIVAWTNGDVLGQRISPAGVPLESAFTVNTTLDNVEAFPSVATTPGGSFVAVWSGYGPGDDSGVFSQRFTTSALPTSLSAASTIVPAKSTGSQNIPLGVLSPDILELPNAELAWKLQSKRSRS